MKNTATLYKGSPSSTGYAPRETCLLCGHELQLVRPGKNQCNHCEIEPDYFAVYVQRSAKARGSFLLNVLARGKADALRIARNHGHKLPRWSYATHIGKAGYYAALRAVFRA
jgi:hypothetical protein